MSFQLYKGGWINKESIVDSVQLLENECENILSKGGGFVRNTFNFDKKVPSSYWYVIKDSFGGIEELSSKKRNQVRKSQKTYDFIRIPKELLLEQGYEIHCKAMAAYKVKANVVSKTQFYTSIDEKGENIDCWMVYDKESGKAVAFGLNTLFENYCDYSVLKADPAYLNNTYPYYGLIYEMNRYYLEEKGYKFVCDGARSITEHSNIQPFLIDTFKFRKAYCDLQIYYKSWFGLIVKILYPFRHLIKHPKVSAILRQEAWRRGCE